MSQKIVIKKALQTVLVDLIGWRATEIVIDHLELDNRIPLDDYSPENIQRIQNTLQSLLGERIAAALMYNVYGELDKMMSAERVRNIGMTNFSKPVNRDDNGENNAIPSTATAQKFPQAVESALDLLGGSAKRALLNELESEYRINIYNGSPSVILPKLEKALAKIFSPTVAVLLIKEIWVKLR